MVGTPILQILAALLLFFAMPVFAEGEPEQSESDTPPAEAGSDNTSPPTCPIGPGTAHGAPGGAQPDTSGGGTDVWVGGGGGTSVAFNIDATCVISN